MEHHLRDARTLGEKNEMFLVWDVSGSGALFAQKGGHACGKLFEIIENIDMHNIEM
jgi:hypothetical protein